MGEKDGIEGECEETSHQRRWSRTRARTRYSQVAVHNVAHAIHEFSREGKARSAGSAADDGEGGGAGGSMSIRPPGSLPWQEDVACGIFNVFLTGDTVGRATGAERRTQ